MAVAPVELRPAGVATRLRIDLRHAEWMGCGALLVIAFVYLMLAGRGTNFYFDDWAWIDARHSGLHQIFASYNQHLVVLPVGLYQLLFRTVGLNHYWVFRTLETLAHLSCVAVVFEFVRRRLGAVALPVAIPFAFLGSGWEYVTLPINFGFVAAIALSVGALLALERDDRKGNVLVCLLLVVAVACADLAVPFALGVAVETMWRDGVLRPPPGVSRVSALRRRGVVWAAPLAIYTAWWLAFYKPSGAHRESISAAIPFAAKLATAAAGAVFGLSLRWGALLLALAGAAIAWRVARDRTVTPRLAGLLVTAVAFWLLVGYGRGRGGVPGTSRYVYAGVVLLILIFAEAFHGIQLSRAAVGLAAVLALCALGQGFTSLQLSFNFEQYTDRRISAELGALQVAQGFAPTSMPLDNTYGRPILAGAYLAAVHAIGSSPADSPTAILAEPHGARAAADRLLLRAGDLSVAAASTRVVPALRGRCTTRPRMRSLVVPLPAGGLSLWAAPGGAAVVRARRFATAFPPQPLTTALPDHQLFIRPAPDGSSTSWQLQISSSAPARICTVS